MKVPKLITDHFDLLDCKNCKGSGVVMEGRMITVPGCCGRAFENGGCCGDPIPVQEPDYWPEPCPECNGEGYILNENNYENDLQVLTEDEL